MRGVGVERRGEEERGGGEREKEGGKKVGEVSVVVENGD